LTWKIQVGTCARF